MLRDESGFAEKSMTVVVATFYRFVRLPDCAELRSPLLEFCQSRGLMGSILLASEGINGTVAGSSDAIAALLTQLQKDPRFSALEAKYSTAATLPFERMKVKLKSEIVTFGQSEADPTQQVGTYVDPADWNQLVEDPDVVLIDTRNDYEVAIGSFERAQNPKTGSFRDFPSYVQTQLDPKRHKKVAMFCTGGIRCEKASAYLLNQGFEQVYHLKGGILKYLETVPRAESRWHGECFVFDERVAVRHGLEPGTYDLCRACGHPISTADQTSDRYEAGIVCPHCYDNLTPEKRAKQKMRRQQLLQNKASQ